MAAWHELVIEGAEEACRAFTIGFAAGRRVTREPVFGRDCGLEHASFGARIRALLAGGSHHVVLAAKELAEPLAGALAACGAAAGLRLERRRVVESMHFGFRVEAYARRIANGIRRDLIDNPPAGVRIEDLSESESEDRSARGTELYSPVHAYIYRASGRFVGRPAEILELRKRASGRDFIEIHGLHVDGRKL